MSLNSRPSQTVAVTVGQALADEGNVYLSLIDGLNLGSGADEKDIMLLRNPAASGQLVNLKSFLVVSVKVSGGTIVRYYRNPTVTSAGTALTEKNKKDDSITGVATTFQLPTISARGTKLGVYGAQGSGQLRHDEAYEVFLEEGEDLLLTLEQPSSNATYSVDLIWSETDI